MVGIHDSYLPLLKFVERFKAIHSRLKGHWWYYEIPGELLVTESSISDGLDSPLQVT